MKHDIQITASPWHEDMLSWICDCGTSSADSYGEIGRAAESAIRHVGPFGANDTWTVRPHANLPFEAIR